MRAVSLGAKVPPTDPLAPVPSRKRTRGDPADWNSPWSSVGMSVFTPALAPPTRLSEPGTNVVPNGIESMSTTLRAPSWPEFLTVMSYCSVSPGESSPPFTSVTSLTTLPLMTGLNRSTRKVRTIGRYWSCAVVNEIVALVAPAGTAFVLTCFASIPIRLVNGGFCPAVT